MKITQTKPHGVTGEAPDEKGLQVTFLLNKREYTHTFLVCSLPTGLLDTDFLEKLGAVIDFESGKMSLSDIGRAPKEYSDSPAKYTAHTVFTGGKAGRSLLLSQQETSTSRPVSTLRRLPTVGKHGLLELRRMWS